MMMNRRHITALGTAAAAVLMALAACTEQQESAAADGIAADGAIRQVAVSMAGAGPQAGDIAVRSAAGATRAADADDQRGSAFQTGDLIYLHMPGALVRPGAAYTVSSTTTAEPAVATEPVVCPNDGADHTVYAYYPYERGQVAVTDNTHSFSVQQDQTGADGYSRSDLMYATATVDGSAADLARPTLTFAHQMSKLILRPYNTNTGAEVKVRRLTLVSGYRTVALQMPECAQGALSDQISTQQPLTVYNNAMDTALPDEAGTPAYICLVPPQTLRQNAPFVRLETTGGVVMTYQLNAQNTLQQGQAYQLDLPVSPVSMTVDIAQWTPVSWTYNTDWTETSHVKQFSVTTTTGGTATFNMRYVEGGRYNTLRGGSHTGTLNDYYIGETEVTERLYKAVMNSTVLTYTYGDNYPVINISHNAFAGFLQNLNQLTADQRPAGYVFAMPSTAQWEWAASGGALTGGRGVLTTASTSPFLSDYDWGYRADLSDYSDKLRPVAGKKPNELGLYDMLGNVGEFCTDKYYLETDLPAGDLGPDYVYISDAVTNVSCKGSSYYNPNSYHTIQQMQTETSPSATFYNCGLRLALVKQPLPVVGDLYFSDGSWGTLASNTSGAAKTAADVVGIVFSTAPSAKDHARGWTHGYVMALNNAGSATWATAGTPQATTQVTDVMYNVKNNRDQQWANLSGDLDGYTHCLTAGCVRGTTTNAANLPAMRACVEYTPAAPAESSGWYLPSIGQHYQITAAFAPAFAGTGVWKNYRPDWAVAGFQAQDWSGSDAKTAINNYLLGKLGELGEGSYTEWGLWALATSTEGSPTIPFYYNYWDSSYYKQPLYMAGNGSKTSAYVVRPVLAF